MRAHRIIVLACGLFVACAVAAQQREMSALVDSGLQRCAAGELLRAVDELQQAYAAAATPEAKARAGAALGLALYRLGRHDEAARLLGEAFSASAAPEARALIANDLGNVHLAQRRSAEARTQYELARRLAPDDLSLQLGAALNLARLGTPAQRLAQLSDVGQRLPALPDELERARFAANLGAQALELGVSGRHLAGAALAQARQIAARRGEHRLQAQVLDALAQLHENEGSAASALPLIDEAVGLAQAVDARDTLYRLEWRRGRLLRARGQVDAAAGAYRRAVAHLEAVRQDIPIEYQDGRSSFRETLAPIYLGLAELLLAQSDGAGSERAQALWREARQAVERVKRSELDDFLGERCTVESARLLEAQALPPGTAVLYPIILPQRLEMLVETHRGLQRHTLHARSVEVQAEVLDFAERLRHARPYATQARALYDKLLRPLEDSLAGQQIDTLVVVPDGVLRLLPFGALMDGERFAVEKYAVATAPALSLTSAPSDRRGPPRALLAGVSQPGPVVDHLPAWMLQTLSGEAEPIDRGAATAGSAAGDASAEAAAAPSRAISRGRAGRRGAEPAVAARRWSADEIRQALALPGVKREIDSLRSQAGGDVLLDRSFTLARFSERFGSGDYAIVHIASHGLFSSSAATSFVMTYDQLLTMDALQQLLRSQRLRRQPIELLTLSACQTAEGDDRAPLGLSGAALKARARSVLGTLWPVSDDATTELMTRLYVRLGETGVSKARALQAVQRAMLSERSLRHPFNWAAFILVGSWQ